MPFATGGYSASALQLRAGRLRDTRGFAQLAHFVFVFRRALQLDEHAPSIAQLEHELSSFDGPRPLVTHVLVHVLRLLSPRAPVDPLAAAVGRAWRREGLDAGDVGCALDGGDVARLVEVVGGTCELVFRRPDRLRAAGGVGQMAPDELRTEPVGRDALDRAYWVLCGHLLYRETPAHVADVLLPASTSAAGVSRRSQRVRRKAGTVSVEDFEACDAPGHALREADGSLWELLLGDGAGREWGAVEGVLGRRPRGRGEQRLVEGLAGRAAEAGRRAAAIWRRSGRGRLAWASGGVAEEGVLVGRKRSARLAGLRERRLPGVDADQRDQRDQRGDHGDARGARARRRRVAREAALAEGGAGDGHWEFRCSCGAQGADFDDGRAMTACERCGVWRHLGCALRAESRRLARPIDEDAWHAIRYVCPDCQPLILAP